MAALSRSLSRTYKSLADMLIITEETAPKAQWELPKIAPSEVYKHKCRFGLKASTYYFESRSVSSTPSSSQSIFLNISSLWDSQKTQAQAKGYNFVHLGLV